MFRIKDYLTGLILFKCYQTCILLACLSLTGCGSLIQVYGDMADAQDPCQMKSKVEGHQRPDWCRSGKSYISPQRVYNAQGQHIATIR